MIYSVWDQRRKEYDYYESPDLARETATSAPPPSHLRSTAVGTVPELAAWPLPAGARKTGSGRYPKGMIASRAHGPMGSIAGLGFFEVTPTNIALWGLAGYLVWRYVFPDWGWR